jgi:hypothetical protein
MTQKMNKIALLTISLLWNIPVYAEPVTLEGKAVIQLKYPNNFIETKRFIHQGIKTDHNDCEFKNKIRLKPGERLSWKRIAYNPETCQALIIEGNYKDTSHK